MLTIEAKLRRGSFALDVAIHSQAMSLGLFGPSGAGKTTLLQVVAGVVRPDVGRVALGDRVLTDTARGVLIAPHRRGAGVVFQEDRLLPHRSVRGNLEYGRRGRPSIAVDAVVGARGLGQLLAKSPRDLSGGERRRVAIGRAVLASSSLLLLDEPLTGLDAGLARRVVALVHRARAAASIPLMAVSHDLDALLDLVGPSGDVAVVDNGRLATLGAASRLDSLRSTATYDEPPLPLVDRVREALA